MVFKGFTDGNGNVIPVQGAGTVYNEEKNSIALGKDTVASGQDQFVFGRKNADDKANTYAEIVGGGVSDIITNKSTIESRIKNISTGSIVTAKIDNYYNTTYRMRLLTHDFTNMSEKITPIGRDVVFQYDGNQTKIIACFEADNVLQKASSGDFANAYFIAIKNRTYDEELLEMVDVVDLYAESQITYDSTPGSIQPVTIKFGYTSMSGTIIRMSDLSTNIRTLDWQGNQWNAGDITCDDGNGNTISMRDLLSRIAALEAAQAE